MNLVIGKQNNNRKSSVDLPLKNSHSKLQHVQLIQSMISKHIYSILFAI